MFKIWEHPRESESPGEDERLRQTCTFVCSHPPPMSVSHWRTYTAHTRQAIYAQRAQLNSIFSNSQILSKSDSLSTPPLSCIMSLHRLVSPSGAASLLYTDFLRDSRTLLKQGTKAGTARQPEVPCRATASEVRNKENIHVCAALEKTSRGTTQA